MRIKRNNVWKPPHLVPGTKSQLLQEAFPCTRQKGTWLFLPWGLHCTMLISCLLLFFSLIYFTASVFSLPNKGCFLKAQALAHSTYVFIGLKIHIARLLVSSSTYKEIGSQTSVPTKGKNWTDRKTNSVSIIHKSGGHWANWGPPDWRDRKANPGSCRFTGAETREQTPFQEPVCGRKTWTVISGLLETQCGKLWELKMPWGARQTGSPTVLW